MARLFKKIRFHQGLFVGLEPSIACSESHPEALKMFSFRFESIANDHSFGILVFLRNFFVLFQIILFGLPDLRSSASPLYYTCASKCYSACFCQFFQIHSFPRLCSFSLFWKNFHALAHLQNLVHLAYLPACALI